MFCSSQYKKPDPKRAASIYRQLSFFLVSLLIANPVILFLATEKLWVSTTITVVFVLAVQVAVNRNLKLVTVYLVNFAVIGSIFLHAEVIFVSQFPDYIIDNLYSFEGKSYFNKPYLKKTFRDKEYTAEYFTNVQGLRIETDHDPDQEIAMADWLFIGDSFTQGAQVTFDKLFSSLLYKKYPNKIIVNAGISGFGLPQEYEYYRNVGYRLEPSLIILQLSSFNDFMKVQLRTPGFTEYLAQKSSFLRFLLQDLIYENPAQLPLGRWTEPFYAKSDQNRDYNIFYNEFSQEKTEDLEQFSYYLQLFKEEVRKHGSRLLVVLLPTKEQTSIKYLEEVMNAFEISSSQLNMLKPNLFLEELCNSLEIEFIDLLDAFRVQADPVFFEYDEHLTPLGHAIVADAIAEHLEVKNQPRVNLLSNKLAGDRYPRYSLDGDKMMYQSFRDGNSELFMADADFRKSKRLTFNDIDESHPVLFQNNSRVIFTEGKAKSLRTNVVMMNIDGSGRTTITEGESQFGAIPDISQNGSLLAYAQWYYSASKQAYSQPQIVLLDRSSEKITVLTEDKYESWRPVFSPNGKLLAYISKKEEQFDLFLLDLETFEKHQLTSTTYDEWDPMFSNDNRFLIYSAYENHNWDLFLLDLENRIRRKITDSKGDEWDPTFSPDDRRIVFAGQFGFNRAIYEIPINSK